MKLVEKLWRAEFRVLFTVHDLETLAHFSDHHYDHVCRSFNRHGGIIAGMRSRLKAMEGEDSIVIDLTWHEVDILCKILEADYLPGDIGRSPLSNSMLALLKSQVTPAEALKALIEVHDQQPSMLTETEWSAARASLGIADPEAV